MRTGYKNPLPGREPVPIIRFGFKGVEPRTWGNKVALTADAFETAAEWQNKAACRDTDPALFFPIGTTGGAIDQIASAKEVCLTCMSRDACLEFALATNQDTGVWGGTSEEERRVIRRRLRSARV